MERMTVNGAEVMFYTIGDFAKAIDRDSQTIRKWEYKGVMPVSKFKRRTGVRLYPEEFVMRVKELCKKYKIAQGRSIPTEFSSKVAEAYSEISDRIIKGGGSVD